MEGTRQFFALFPHFLPHPLGSRLRTRGVAAAPAAGPAEPLRGGGRGVFRLRAGGASWRLRVLELWGFKQQIPQSGGFMKSPTKL